MLLMPEIGLLLSHYRESLFKSIAVILVWLMFLIGIQYFS